MELGSDSIYFQPQGHMPLSILSDTLTIVLAGDRGSSLGSLTRDRAKAAVPFGGEYRMVDFVLSNCLHSGLRRVYVLTQYHAHSLHEHLRSSWGVFNPELGEFITAVPPQIHDGQRWYEGNSRAVAENLFLVRRSGAKQLLVVSGSHLYRMDYAALLEAHHARKAQATIGYVEVAVGDAKALDTLTLDDKQRVTHLTPACEQDAAHISDQQTAFASMGAMVLEVDFLTNALEAGTATPRSTGGLAAQMLPSLLDAHRVFGYRFGGRKGRVSQDRFFSSVPDIDAYFRANMTLLEPVPPLDLYQEDWPIWSQSRRLPPARTVGSRNGNEGLFVNSIVSNGTVITGGAVTRSVLSPKVRVNDSATVENCILFDGVEVGEKVQLRNCIIDKYARIPAGMQIGLNAREDAEKFEVTPKGVVVVPKGYPDVTPSAGDR
ncbi:MAG: glucose-1-phosphate adenylyltransferase [Gammaproteobacteria bacterium]